ncbi:MAG: hypothetical protein AAFP04_10470 [Myxococcota bacterium]
MILVDANLLLYAKMTSFEEHVDSHSWLDVTWCPTATAEHESVLTELLQPGGITPKRVMDAHLAALALEHGLALCSADGDFTRFQSLRWINPLVA